MKIGEIEDLWSEDCTIRLDDLANDSANIGKLHSKYYKIYRSEKIILKALEFKYQKALRIKSQFYMGTLSDEELRENGLLPFGRLILKQDLNLYLDADDDLVTILLKVSNQKDKVDFLESIIRVVNNRSFAIKNALDFLRFCQGDPS